MLKPIIPLVVAVVVCLSTAAQTVTVKRGWIVEFAGWRVFAALNDSQAVGFLAVAEPDAMQGDNLPFVWYQRDAELVWSSWTWTDAELSEVVAYVREITGIQNLWQNEDQMTILLAGSPADHQFHR